MKKLKTFLCSALAIVSLLSLTACGSKTQSPTDPIDQPTAEPTVAVQDATETTLPNGMTQIDAFADFKYSISDISPRTHISFASPQTINGVSVAYEIQNPKNTYKNGETITIKAIIQNNNDKYVLKEESKDFVIETEDYYIETAEEITEENMTALRNAANAALDEYIDYWQKSGDFKFDEPEPIGHEFWFIKDATGVADINHLVFYYQINATDKDGNDASSYTYVMFTNIIQYGGGTQYANPMNYSMPDMSDYEVMYPTMNDLEAAFDERYEDRYEVNSYFAN